MSVDLNDNAWLQQAFIIPPDVGRSNEDYYLKRVFTDAGHSFTDTTLGGSFVINPRPQFTSMADPKVKSKFANASKGKGRYYHEVLESNQQVVTFRVGQASFNSLTRFFGEFYSVEAGAFARRGRAPDLFFDLGSILGTVATVFFYPMLLVSKIIRFALQKPASRYFYLSPCMYLYWSAVSSTSTRLGVNMGIIPRVLGEKLGTKYYEDNERAEAVARAEAFHMIDPGIYNKDGSVDIFRMSTRAQRLAFSFADAMENEAAKGKSQKELFDTMTNWVASDNSGTATIEAYQQLYSKMRGYAADSVSMSDGSEVEIRGDERLANDMFEYNRAERQMGADYVSYRVEHMESITDTFSNASKESAISATINGISSGSRETRFSVADGNIDSAGLTKFVTESITSLLNGVAYKFEIGGLAALAGSAFVDIPEMWDNSSAQVNGLDIRIELRTPYNNPLSRLQNIMIPLSGLLAIALPLSTGKQSYTSPFLLEVYSRGRCMIRLGMVERITIERGVGEIGWTPKGEFMGVNVSLTIKDLSRIVHMPIEPKIGILDAAVIGAGTAVGATLDGVGVTENGSSVGAALGAALVSGTFDEDNLYSDYMSTLGSVDLATLTATSRRFKHALTQKTAAFEAWRSKARYNAWMYGGTFGDIVKLFNDSPARWE